MTNVAVEHKWDEANWDWPLQHKDGVVKVHNAADGFKVSLEAPYFTPKEIKVVVQGDEVIVTCQHDERSDMHGKVSRSVMRAYHLPSDVDKASVKSHLDARGLLHIEAKKK